MPAYPDVFDFWRRIRVAHLYPYCDFLCFLVLLIDFCLCVRVIGDGVNYDDYVDQERRMRHAYSLKKRKKRVKGKKGKKRRGTGS